MATEPEQLPGVSKETLRDRLAELLRTRSLQIGNFKLVSGAKSHYYFDSKPTTLDPEGSFLTAYLILEELKSKGIEADAIGGLTLGADPIVSAVATISHVYRHRFRPLSAFIVRKEPKKHGTQRFLEGYVGPAGTRAVIVDDVCTSGESTRKAIEQARAAGFLITAVVCLVDRQQGARESFDSLHFIALFTAQELLDHPDIQARLAALT